MKTTACNLEPILDKVRGVLESHRLDLPGTYARWIWQNPQGSRQLGLNPYGCADAANLLYTIGEFPSDEAERRSWIEVLQNLQNPETGEYNEATHCMLHTTAHCIAALELFDQRPLHPLRTLKPYLQREKLYELLEGLRWVDSPWDNSHKGAGIFVALVLTGMADEQWKAWYFDWFYQEADPKTGLWRRGCLDQPDSLPLYHHMAGSFHYLFNHESERMPLRYPEQMVDSCLELASGLLPSNFGKAAGFLEVDWVYCLSRSWRQCGRRTEEVRQALCQFALSYYDYLMSVDGERDEGFNDLHMLFGTVCALAELQQCLPGLYHSRRPLKLVLDRRPFI